MRPTIRTLLTAALATSFFGVATTAALAQTPSTPSAPPAAALTLADAVARALAHHPNVLAAQDVATAAAAATRETTSTRYPTIFGNLTAVDALSNSRIAAGGLNNPIIYDRYSNGVALSQLVTDFGRSGNLAASAQSRQDARTDDVNVTRADIVLAVTSAYLGALRAEAVQQVADDTVRARQLVLDQVTALAKNQLKSELDVSFAGVNVSQARLLASQAKNDVRARFADLTAAMGDRDQASYVLTDPDDAGSTAPPMPDVEALVRSAMTEQPRLLSVRADFSAASHYAAAQGDLWRPTVSFLAAAGVTPFRQDTLTDRYAAAGFNVTIPIFNGHLYGAERTEAEARADEASQKVRETENLVARDIRVAGLDAEAAFERLSLTAELVSQATQALSLAQSRYDLGLSSIVELSQAQLNATEARLAQANARYGYAAALAFLRYQAGKTP